MGPRERKSAPNLDSIAESVPSPGAISEQEDLLTREEFVSFTREAHSARITSITQDTSERKKYARKFFVLACAWVFVITAILVLQGFGTVVRFNLSEKIVLAAIGSTTLNIVGILFVVAKYLFPKK